MQRRLNRLSTTEKKALVQAEMQEIRKKIQLSGSIIIFKQVLKNIYIYLL